MMVLHSARERTEEDFQRFVRAGGSENAVSACVEEGEERCCEYYRRGTVL